MSESPYPEPRLVPTADAVRPGEPLALRVEIHNPGPRPLEGAKAELTLETERGVLITWLLALCDVPPKATVRDARRDSRPDWELPLNVTGGVGQFTLALLGEDGAHLNEAELELPVEV